MKKLLVTLSLIVSLSHAQKLTNNDFIMHEWGSLNVIQGSDQAIIGGLVDDQSDLPEFVHVWEKNPKKVYPAPLIIEKPIIYFYTNQVKRISVKVECPKGIVTQWWPAASDYAPNPSKNGNIAALTGGMVTWNDLFLRPQENIDNSFLMNTDNHLWWPVARNTDSAIISNAEGISEKFLFYRGISDYSPSLKANYENDKWSFNSDKDKSFKNVMTIHVSKDKNASIKYYPSLILNDISEPTSIDTPAEAATILQSTLESAGLYTKEAKGMVEIWKDTLFSTPGTRFIYFMKDETLEEMLPLTINPTPTEIKRIMLVRVEMLNKERENIIKDWISQLADPSYKVRDTATQALMKQGRAGQALMRKSLSESKDPEVTHRLKPILDKISPIRPEAKAETK